MAADQKSCALCAHQAICAPFSLFKTGVEPNILDNSKAQLKAENLAWICGIYSEDVKQGRIKESRIVRDVDQ